MNDIAVITTFGNQHWNVYARDAIQSFVKYWPAEVPLLVQLDDDAIKHDVGPLLRPQDGLSSGWKEDHAAFVERNSQFDDPTNYRKQVTRFCHKVFAIYNAYSAYKDAKAAGAVDIPRYLIWMDADVITTQAVSIDQLRMCLPVTGDAVSYLGRKDWPHSECGWLAFDMEAEGGMFIDVWHGLYVTDAVLKLTETHDSWVFDHVRQSEGAPKCTDLTEGKPGMDIWPQSPMGQWSTHHKGPVAKNKMVAPDKMRPMGGKIIVETRNSIPDEEIRSHIRANQRLIKNWLRSCKPSKEQVVVVSAGPQLVAEDVLEDYRAGKKIVAVKHALEPLKAAGIKPWASILLDPRPHVSDFVDNPDPDILWFVASQVNPDVTMKLLAAGCTVWGYHAAVGAGEGDLTGLQPDAIVSGGSATATRGLFVLKHLGFNRIKLFGYDLCFPDKVDLNARDEMGQPKFLEISLGWNNPLCNLKRCFWTEPQLLAQFEEMNNLIQGNVFDFEAVGDGIIPFVIKGKRTGELRQGKLKDKINPGKPLRYGKLLKWNNPKKTKFLTTPLRTLRKTLRRTIKTLR